MDSKVGTSDSKSGCKDRMNKTGGWLESLPPSIIQRIRDSRNKYDETESVKSSLVLPPEIIQEIYLKLSISYVVQCSLVCKSFVKVSKSQNFALMHIKHGTDNSPFIIFHSKSGLYGSFPNYLGRLNIASMDGYVGTVQRVNIPFQDIMVDYLVIGSCLGYLCLVSQNDRSLTKCALLLYNPLTSDFKELPVPSQVSNTLFAYGYGYHAGIRKYKVLITSQQQIKENMNHIMLGSNRENERLEVQILTIGAEKWRTLETPSCWLKKNGVQRRFMPEKQGLWINGSLYWLTSTQSQKIIALDLASEKFQEITAPSGASHLLAIRGNLSGVVNNEQGSWEIWVRKDNDVPESWSRDFVLGHYMPAALRLSNSSDNDRYLKYVRFVCCLNNGKFLLKYGCKAWCYYDPETELYEDLTICGLPEEFETIAHVGSLSYLKTLG